MKLSRIIDNIQTRVNSFRDRSIRCMMWLVCLSPCASIAGTETPAPANPVSGGLPADYFTKLGLGLLFVIAAFFAFTWLLRRVNGLQTRNAGLLRVVSSASVGNRERLVIVSVGGKQLLLGVCPGNIQTLHVLDGEAAEQPPAAPNFTSQLKAALTPEG